MEAINPRPRDLATIMASDPVAPDIPNQCLLNVARALRNTIRITPAVPTYEAAVSAHFAKVFAKPLGDHTLAKEEVDRMAHRVAEMIPLLTDDTPPAEVRVLIAGFEDDAKRVIAARRASKPVTDGLAAKTASMGAAAGAAEMAAFDAGLVGTTADLAAARAADAAAVAAATVDPVAARAAAAEARAAAVDAYTASTADPLAVRTAPVADPRVAATVDTARMYTPGVSTARTASGAAAVVTDPAYARGTTPRAPGEFCTASDCIVNFGVRKTPHGIPMCSVHRRPYDWLSIEAAYIAKSQELIEARNNYTSAIQTIQRQTNEIEDLRAELEGVRLGAVRTAPMRTGRTVIVDDGSADVDMSGFADMMHHYHHFKDETANVFIAKGDTVFARGTTEVAMAGAFAYGAARGGYENMIAAGKTLKFGNRTPTLSITDDAHVQEPARISQTTTVGDISTPGPHVLTDPVSWDLNKRYLMANGSPTKYWYLDPSVRRDVALEHAHRNRADAQVAAWAARNKISL